MAQTTNSIRWKTISGRMTEEMSCPAEQYNRISASLAETPKA